MESNAATAAGAPTMANPVRKRKGARPKRQPQRTCIACRDKTEKRGLTRIVRAPDGAVSVDPTGRANGRGAYLCGNPRCWQRALDSGLLQHALRVELDARANATLSEYAARHLPETPDEPSDRKEESA
jgi:predicted RNA-binding protein YlxR (DUF448 family)